ncbi:hypothetical protein D3C79_771700 [compost metagenome]
MRRPQIGQLRPPGAEGQQQRQREQHKAAHDLHRPGGVEEQWVVAAVALNDVLPQADIGQQVQQHRNGRGNDHHPKHFRQQYPRHDQVAAQAQHLRGHQRDQVPCACAHGTLAQTGRCLHINRRHDFNL